MIGRSFGTSVDIDGERAVVGAMLNGPGTSGTVYLFDWDGARWVEQGSLVASDALPDDSFGVSVDMEGDTLMVGALASWLDKDNRISAVYVFRYDGSRWVEVQKIAVGGAYKQFGASIGMHGDTAIIGAPQDSTYGVGFGAAYVFQ